MSPGDSLDTQTPGFSLPGYQHTFPLAKRGSLDQVQRYSPEIPDCRRQKLLQDEKFEARLDYMFQTNQPTSHTNKTLNAYYHYHAGISAIHSVSHSLTLNNSRVPDRTIKKTEVVR